MLLAAAAEVEFWFFDDEENPLALAYRSASASRESA